MSSFSTDDYRRTATALLALGAALALLLAIPLARADLVAPSAERSQPLESVVEPLVRDALEANLELAVAGASVDQRRAALDVARAHYLPALDLSARYSRADGGRVIDFPVGDLLNPVYATLNQLTGQTAFPSVQNQRIRLLRSPEQETKFTLTQPLYDGRLGPARDAAAAQLGAETARHEALEGRIARDMRTAYYRWLQSREQVAILDATLALGRENQRVNASLYKNGKITRDLVYRAEADVLEVEQSRLGAIHARAIAQSYVNLLRNAPFDRELVVGEVPNDELAIPQSPGTGGLDALAERAIGGRAELKVIDAARAAASASERLAHAAFRPQLAFALDAGTQGGQYRFGADDRYVLASVVLKFNLYSGGADAAGLAGARAAGRSLDAQRALEAQRIRLEVQQGLQNLDLSRASVTTAMKRVEAAAGGFRIAQKKRDLGQINQAEFIDARRVLTDAQLNLNVTRFETLRSLAELDYALGSGTHHWTFGTLP